MSRPVSDGAHKQGGPADRRSSAARCWLCDSERLIRVQTRKHSGELTSDSFQITDAAYGVTLAIDCCEACGFLQCTEAADPVAFYTVMTDDEYEETRPARLRQARSIVDRTMRFKRSGAWLDVGAGSGITVEAARQAGFAAEGVEPSEWLATRGRGRGLDIHTGVLPHPDVTGLYDVVSLVDVVEHVTDPVGLLKSLAAVLKPDGVGCIVTPDVRSVFARLLGWKWWHFRIAHVGYFSIETLDHALLKAGLERVAFLRPTWHLPADYLAERALQYAPKRLAPPVPKALGRIAVPVNLRDSLMAFVRKTTS